MQAPGNMNEQDVIENGSTSIAAAILMVICALYYFLTFFLTPVSGKGSKRS